MKKKQVAKELAILMAATIMGGVLAGCGASGQDTQNTAASSKDVQGEGASIEQETGETETADEGSQEVTIIRASTTGSPAPYMTVDDAGNPDGYDIIVFETLVDRLPQYELEWTVADDSLTGVLSGQYDVSVNNWAYRDERAESYYYSLPYKITDKVFIQRADDEPLTSLSDAAERGYTIEVGASGAITNALQVWNENNPDKQIELVYTEADFLVKFQHILDGQMDFGCEDSPIFYRYAEEFGFTGELVGNTLNSEAMADVLPSVYTYFLFSKDEKGAALRADLDAELKAMYEDGTLAALSQEYFNTDVTPPAEAFEKEPN